MSSEKRRNSLLNYSFSKKPCTSTENSGSMSTVPSTPISTILMTNADSDLSLVNNPAHSDDVLDQLDSDSDIESSELKVINSRSDTSKNVIGYYLFNKLSIDDYLKYSLLTNHFKPDGKYRFPTLYSADHKHFRRFLMNWLNDSSFLVYSPYIEGCYCINCVLFRNVQGQKLKLFVDKPCYLYKHLKHFTTSLKSHINSQFHQNSTMALDNFIRTYQNPSLSISSLFDKGRIERINRNKAILISIIKVIITCSRQNIVLRGHRDETIDDIRKTIHTIDSPYGSNFVALLKHRVDSGDEILHEHLESGPKNASYIGMHQTQKWL